MKPLRVVIVEDEPATARNLAHLLGVIDPKIRIAETMGSITESGDWFKQHPDDYELIFMDIKLADGLSFDIFKAANITKPVIFVTAYNDYAIQAFKSNGIDYILKPFDGQELSQALNKYKGWMGGAPAYQPNPQLLQLLQQLNTANKPYKKSFLVHFRDKLVPIETIKIAWFYTADEIIYARMADDRQFIMEFTMEQLEQQIDPAMFYRANRQFIINRNAISEVDFYFNGRLAVKVKPEPPDRVLISKARVPEFKSWMNS